MSSLTRFFFPLEGEKGEKWTSAMLSSIAARRSRSMDDGQDLPGEGGRVRTLKEPSSQPLRLGPSNDKMKMCNDQLTSDWGGKAHTVRAIRH